MATLDNGNDSDNNALLRRRRKHFAGAFLFYKNPVDIVKGEGVWLFDRRGNRYLDCYNNVASVGHRHPKVVDALSTRAAILNTQKSYDLKRRTAWI